MVVVNLINKKIREYAQKRLEKKLYFFCDSGDLYQKVIRPLFKKGVDGTTLIAIDHSNFDFKCRDYISEYLKNCKEFLTLTVKRSDLYTEGDTVVTLPDREQKVRELLQKLNYKIAD